MEAGFASIVPQLLQERGEEVDSGKKEMEKTKESYTEQMKMTEGARKEEAEFAAKGPGTESIPAGPSFSQLYNPKDFQKFFGIAAALTALSAGLGRGHGMRALYGLAGASKGFLQGKQDIADAQMKEAEDNFKRMVAENHRHVTEFNATLSSKHLSSEAQDQKLREILVLGGFDQKVREWDLGQRDKVFQWALQQERATLAAQQHVEDRAERRREHEENIRERREYHQGLSGGGAGGGPAPGAQGEEVLKGVEPGVAQIVKSLVNYKIPLPSGFALRSPYWQKIMQLATLYDPSFDASQYNVRMQLRKDFASGKAAQNIRSLNTAVQHLDSLSKDAEQLKNSPVQLWNRIANYGLTATGDPRVTNFNSSATAVESELANVFKGTGATDQEIKAWRDNLSSVQSPDQLKGAINKVVELMGGRVAALTSQYEKGMGKPKDFTLLSPKARETLSKLGVDINALDPVVGAYGGTGSSSTPAGKPSRAERFDQIQQSNSKLSDEQIYKKMIEEGY